VPKIISCLFCINKRNFGVLRVYSFQIIEYESSEVDIQRPFVHAVQYDMFHTTQPAICTYKIHIKTQFLLHVSAVDRHSQWATPHTKTIKPVTYITKLTPWSRALLEKLVKKFRALYGTRKFITSFIKIPAPVPLLSQINPVNVSYHISKNPF